MPILYVYGNYRTPKVYSQVNYYNIGLLWLDKSTDTISVYKQVNDIGVFRKPHCAHTSLKALMVA